jgi:hypothetical protein
MFRHAMLRHRLPSYRRLMHEGQGAAGLILAVKEPRTGTLGLTKFKLRLRARLPDGEVEFETLTNTRELLGEYAHAGDVWPVRFDPADRSRIDVDLPELRKRILAERERIETDHRRLGEERFERERSGQADEAD